MNITFGEEIPLGLYGLSVFYILNSLLVLVSTFIFYDYIDILIFGITANDITAFLVKAFLIIFPLYLAHGISLLKKKGLILAIVYQFFFIMNAALAIFDANRVNPAINPILEIALKPEYKVVRISDFFKSQAQLYSLQTAGILIGIIIISYLLAQRRYFDS